VTTLLVASAGGHIQELTLLRDQLGLDGPVQWVTSDSAQTRSLLRGETVHWMPRVGSREYTSAMRALPRAYQLHRRVKPSLVVTTGALAAAPHILAASMNECPIWYVESATRRSGPSRTGRLASRLPRTRLLAQGEGWGDGRWESIPDVFSAFQSIPRPGARRRPVRVLVSLGTERFPFPRAVDRLAKLLDGFQVTWQVGSTHYVRDGARLTQLLPSDELRAACAQADVVITHAGVGSALMALSAGKVPVLLPRRAELGEHVDDHQGDFGSYLTDRRLAISVDPDELTGAHLRAAFERIAVRRTNSDLSAGGWVPAQRGNAAPGAMMNAGALPPASGE